MASDESADSPNGVVINIPFKLVEWARTSEGQTMLEEVVRKTEATEIYMEDLEEVWYGFRGCEQVGCTALVFCFGTRQ